MDDIELHIEVLSQRDTISRYAKFIWEYKSGSDILIQIQDPRSGYEIPTSGYRGSRIWICDSISGYGIPHIRIWNPISGYGDPYPDTDPYPDMGFHIRIWNPISGYGSVSGYGSPYPDIGFHIRIWGIPYPDMESHIQIRDPLYPDVGISYPDLGSCI